jgi:hypothetical protein
VASGVGTLDLWKKEKHSHGKHDWFSRLERARKNDTTPDETTFVFQKTLDDNLKSLWTFIFFHIEIFWWILAKFLVFFPFLPVHYTTVFKHGIPWRENRTVELLR